MFMMIPKDMANVLAKKALNAFPKFLLVHSYIGGTACYQAHCEGRKK